MTLSFPAVSRVAGSLAFRVLVACAVLQTPALCAAAEDAGADAKLLERLIWESPWEGRAAAPSGQSFTYRATFSNKRSAPTADVTALYNNARGSSSVRVQDGVVHFQHPTGAEITVRPDEKGHLVGTAQNQGVTLSIVYKPLP